MEITQAEVTARGVDFAYLECGSGPLALCLHGFPDSAWTFRHLLPDLAEAGYRAVAPWMRGYAPTGVPADGRYQSGALVADACALHEALGGDGDAVVIGHDWGAGAAAGAAAWEPDRWRRVVTMAVLPRAFGVIGYTAYEQLRRFWYLYFFQLPFADAVVAANDLTFIDRLYADWSPNLVAGEHLELVKPSLRGPDNLAAALGYYRALFDASAHDPALAEAEAAAGALPSQPLLHLHGVDDGCVGVELARAAEGQLTAAGSRVELFEGAGHFLHLEAPPQVNALIVRFLAA
jgi:pimeloyl-ACP methyl ester carboxylesterase